MKAQNFTSRGVVRALAGITVLALVFPLAAAAGQQKVPLAEVARKEAERRKTAKPTQKVITTKDLPESAKRPAAAPGAPAEGVAGAAAGGTAAAPSGGAAAATAAPTDDRGENYWRGRITNARESLRRNEMFAQALQTRVNALTTDFGSRDDPYQRARIGEERTKAIEELARVKGDLEQAKKQIDEIQEEARKAGVPPGWLR